MREFKINDYYNIYKNTEFAFEPGVSCLVGRNGSGKTTLLQEIKRTLEKENVPCFMYDNYKQGGANAMDKYAFHGDMELLATAFSSSEGERIIVNYGQTLKNIGSFVRKSVVGGAKEIFILLDALDSGLSINNIREIKSVFKLIIKDAKASDIYIIFSANAYEMAKGEKCIDVSTGEKITFTDYENYAELICKK